MRSKPRGEQRPLERARFIWPPYDFRPLRWEQLRGQIWNPGDRRLFPPKRVGWGYTINLHELLARLRLVRRP